MKNILLIYNRKRSLYKDGFDNKRLLTESLPPVDKDALHCAVVIPLFREYPEICETIDSLLASAGFARRLFHIICVINNLPDAPGSVRENNEKTAKYLVSKASGLQDATRDLAAECKTYGLFDKTCGQTCSTRDQASPADTGREKCSAYISVLDFYSEGLEMTAEQGVGYARKAGMDYALMTGADIIACMDGDTLVPTEYAECLFTFAEKYRGTYAYCTADFFHRPVRDEDAAAVPGLDAETLQNAVSAYEQYLKEHSRLLQMTGTPYYPAAIGPLIVCTSFAYASCGGMNTRTAGEDFYFLQALIKSGLPRRCLPLGCAVYPSPRVSDRVLFGTGPKLAAMTAGTEQCSVFPQFMYDSLAHLIQLLKKENPADLFLNGVHDTIPAVYRFLELDGFISDWPRIVQNAGANMRSLETAFFTRFDGLKIIRLFHFLHKQ